MTLDLEKWLSRKLGALILFTVFAFQLPDLGNPWVLIAKIVCVGGVAITYLWCQAKQNIVEVKYLGINPETEENGEGKVTNTTNTTNISTGASTGPGK